MKAKVLKDISKDVFSVDYKTNTIYTRNLNSLNGTISFTYSCINLNAFTIAKEVDISIDVPSTNTQHIQECHMLSYHIITEIVENTLFKGDAR
jgi:phosphoheptose isomerase